MLEVQNKRSVTIAAGVQGTGKSTFGLRLMANAEPAYAVHFIFDPEGEYEQRLGMPAVSDLYGLSLELCREPAFVIFDPHPLFPGQTEEGFAFFNELAFEKSAVIPGRKLLVVDEAWRYTNTRREPVELAMCTRSGRKRGLECLFNTQTPHLLHASIRNECSELICFRLGDDLCLEMPRKRGFDVEAIKALPDLHFISRNLDSGGELRGEIRL